MLDKYYGKKKKIVTYYDESILADKVYSADYFLSGVRDLLEMELLSNICCRCSFG